METYPLWKDLYYENASDNPVEFRIIADGSTEIFHGVAQPSPLTGLIRIKVNDICASYLNSALDNAEVKRALGLDALIPTNAYNEFSLEIYNTAGARWDTAMEWGFINDTSYEPWRSGEGLYSEPINSHAAPGQMLAASYLILEPTYTVCHNGTSIFFIITRGQAEDIPESGGTWEIDYDTNLENAYYEMRRRSAQQSPITGYTSGGEISFNIEENPDVFDEEYEVIFYSEPNGIELGRAVATIGAGEGSGFSYFLRIKNAPSYITSAGTSQAIFDYRTNCDGQIKYELSSSSTRYTGYQICQTGITDNLERLTISIPANPIYEPRYFRMEIYGSDAADPYNWLVSDYTDFEQQDRQHYFFFTTDSGQALPWSATTNTITWATDYDEVKWEFNRDNNFVSSGTSTTGGAMLTFPANDSLGNVTYTLNAYTTGDTPLGTIIFYQLDEAGEYAFEYFGIQALSSGTIGITSTHDPAFTLEYSKNNAEWIPVSTTALSLDVATIGVAAGDRVRFRGDTYPYSVLESGQSAQGLHFVISGTPCDIYGNILSLSYGDNYSGATAPHAQGNYAYLFSKCTAIKSAKNLFLPDPYANDYEYLFLQCSGMTTPPKIPSSTAPGSYRNMFNGCKALEYAPSLMASTAAEESYYGMFEGCTGLTSGPAISATTINARAFKNMFNGCSGLTAAPMLAATTVGDNAYDSMFKGCRRLTAPANWNYNGGGTEACAHMYSGCTALLSTPALPAADSAYVYYGMFEGCTALINTQSALTCTGDAWTGAFENMFHGCISLTTAPSISGIYTIPQRGFAGMFNGCISLTAPPDFPSSYAALAPECFTNMFEGCTGLTSAPSLPWTTLADGCYAGMFRGCDLLTTAPSLPAMTLAPNCYAGMFQQCDRLVTAPILRATVVPRGAYSYMFNWCGLLDYIECLATDISAEDSTLNFTSGTARSGVFVKSSAMHDWEYGPNGIPDGWTIENV